MVARLFAAASAALALTAASASAQCGSGSYGGPVHAGYATPAAYGSSCCGGSSGYAMSAPYAPYGMSGAVASSESSGRRGLFGRRAARRSNEAVVTADYAAMPFAPAFNPSFTPVAFAQPIPMSDCPPASGVIVTSGTVPPAPMPAPMPTQGAVIGSVAPMPSGPMPAGPMLSGAMPSGPMPGPIPAAPIGGVVMQSPGMTPYTGMPIGDEMSYSTTSGGRTRTGLFSRLRLRR